MALDRPEHRCRRACHRVGERGDRQLGVGDDRVVGLVDLVDLAGIDVDVDQRLVGQQIGPEVEGGVLGEAVAHRQDHLGLAEGLPGGAVAAVAEDADRKRMVLGQHALAVERGEQRDLKALEKRGQIGAGAAADRAEAHQRYDPLFLCQRGAQHGGDLGDPGGVRAHRRDLQPDVAIIVDRDAAVGEILRHVDMNRAGAALEGEVDGFLQHLAGPGRIGQQERFLGGGGEHLLGVGRAAGAGRLVQRPLALPRQRRKSGNGQHRIGIGHRDGEPGEQVERSRSRGGRCTWRSRRP